MRPRISAGLVIYRVRAGDLQVFLAHPGGPFFRHKDNGHWTIPKGEIEPGEDYLTTALREVEEEVGIMVPRDREFIELGSIRQKGGKVVHGWGVEWDFDDSKPIRSNTFNCEWPMGSGRIECFPEVDRAQFFPIKEAKNKIKETQIPLLDQLEIKLKQA